jgi:O-methyltransferase
MGFIGSLLLQESCPPNRLHFDTSHDIKCISAKSMNKLAAQFRILKTNLARESSKLVRKTFAPRGMRELPPKYPQDFSPFTRELWDKVRPYTMTSQSRVANLERAVRYILTHGIDGDFVECGVGAGGSMMAIAYTLLEVDISDRRLLLYDTFSGMARPTEEDVSILGKPATRKYDRKTKDGECTWHNFPLADVRANMNRTSYPTASMSFHPGYVQDTLPSNDSVNISLLRLDTNLYESTVVECEQLIPKLSAGGVLIIDDYFRWLGQQKAVDEYLKSTGQKMLLTRIADHAAMGVKQ